MFCPSCGIEDTIGLPYCNRCGANLGGTLTAQPVMAPISVTKPALIIGATIIILTLGGFAMLITGAIELSHSVQGGDPIIATVVLGMITLLTADIFLVRLLSRLISAALPPNQPQQLKRSPAPAMLSASAAPELPRPITSRLEPAPSVTEHTTRFFEPVYRAPAEAKEPANREELEK
jgi:hypothetical protein